MITDGGRTDEISNISRAYFSPEAADSVFQGVARYLRPKWADQTMDFFLVEIDLLRRRAESNTQMGGTFPEAFVSAMRM